MTYTPVKTLTVEDFLTQYIGDPRYELIDGELRNLEPTGPHESVAGTLAGHWFSALSLEKKAWIIPKNCLIQPPATQATVLRPDVILLDREKLSQEPLWSREPIISSGQAIVAVAEVVSSNWQDDYARKIEEYRFLGIQEYWIVDFKGLGGIAFIGKPKQPTLTIFQLKSDDYVEKQYRLNEPIESKVFSQLKLTLNDLMP
ncbi:MAG: Uma2 family endonuclease [Cyanobacteria bacterium J06553_1]